MHKYRNLQTSAFGVALLAFSFYALPAVADEQDSLGDWMLVVKQGRTSMDGVLRIQSGGVDDRGVIAHVEGGPIRISIDGEQIEMAIDDRTAGGMPFERYLRGELDGNTMSGTFGPEHPINEQQQDLCERLPMACPHPTGTWTATRYVAPPNADSERRPVDLSGTWVYSSGGLRRWTADLTESALAWKADFNVELDLPRQRCLSSGLVATFGFRGYDPEIFQSDIKLTMLLGSEVRRIYLDGRRPPEYSDYYPMGFSSGRWEGSTLVVETDYLMPSVREWMGDPISEDARVTERYSLSEDGILTGVMTLHDPANYVVPMTRRAHWRRGKDTEAKFPVLCDPDSFYRQVYDEGRMDDYIKRGNRRY
jgi:hypothetical protein